MLEKHHRSILKSISWRLTGTFDTLLISYLITGDAAIAAAIGGVEIFSKMILYYFHERDWNKTDFGREKVNPEYHI